MTRPQHVIHHLLVRLQAGKLDLTEVEGLADLLAAETEAQRVQVGAMCSCVRCLLAPQDHPLCSSALGMNDNPMQKAL